MELMAPAKINLSLSVVGRRQDGYHELISLMCCVGLYESLELRFDRGPTGITCSHPDLPGDETNLALKAVRLFHRSLRQISAISSSSVTIRLKKNIPIGAGLGGGSSDAAAVLKGLNAHYGRPFVKSEILALALELGADVPFFIEAIPAVVRGIGEKLDPYFGLNPMAVVIVFPGFSISTAEVFRRFNLRLTNCEKKIRNFPFNNGAFLVTDHLSNDLEKVVLQQFPIIAQIKKKLLALGADGALMSGSGSAVFGLFANEAEARKAGKVFLNDSGYQVFVTETLC
jgi:4-diphosphocytidyl-2-C-methyl-D-erythritol kinase